MRKIKLMELDKDRVIEILRRLQEPEAWEQKITQEAFDALEIAIEALTQERVQNDAMPSANVILDSDEAEALADYLWCSFVPYIQDKDNEVDNLLWIRLITGIWYKCNKLTNKKSGGAIND